jgi:hypothetical protein
MSDKIKSYFWQWQTMYIRPRKWMKSAFYSPQRRQYFMVIYPFNHLVELVWWLNWKWSDYQVKPSWIDREIDARKGGKS